MIYFINHNIKLLPTNTHPRAKTRNLLVFLFFFLQIEPMFHGFRRCKRILAFLKLKIEARWFLRAVDWKKDDLPDYPSVITNPMDLSRIERKLPAYCSVDAFISDVELIFLNALHYNTFADAWADTAPLGVRYCAREMRREFSVQILYHFRRRVCYPSDVSFKNKRRKRARVETL